MGGVKIGGGAPVAVQSMTKTETADYDATLKQVRAIADAGADLVRVAVPREKDVEALKRLVVESPIPVIADIHFNHTLALKAIDAGAHCVRLNPGNIGGPDKVAEVAKQATAAGVPMLSHGVPTARSMLSPHRRSRAPNRVAARCRRRPTTQVRTSAHARGSPRCAR